MAAVVHVRSGDNYNGGTFTTRDMAAFTLSGGSLEVAHLLWVVSARSAAAADTPSVSSSIGATDDATHHESTAFDSSSAAKLSIFTFVPTVAGERTISLTWANSHLGYAAGICRLEGVDTTTPFTQIEGAAGSGTDLAVSLAAFANTGNPTLSVMATHSTSSLSPSFTLGTSFENPGSSHISGNSSGTDRSRGRVQWQNANDTSVTGTVASSVPWAIYGMELNTTLGESYVVNVPLTLIVPPDEADPGVVEASGKWYRRIGGVWTPVGSA